MTTTEPLDPDARSIAARLRGRLVGPWDVYAERHERYEVHLSNGAVEMVRGPLRVAGAGVRLFRPASGGLGDGFCATTDLTDEGVDAAVAQAERVAGYSRSPASKIELPGSTTPAPSGVETADARLWADPYLRTVEFARTMLESFAGRPNIVLSFGSVRVSLAETTLANSEGLERSYRHTHVFVEAAAKSFGGPEGRPPGEFWHTSTSRQLETERLPELVEGWAKRALDARRAGPPASGPTKVVITPAALADFAPEILSYRFSGQAELRKMSAKGGSEVASDKVTMYDDGLFPYGLGSSPFDDEGAPRGKRALIRYGVAMSTLQDAVHASALGTVSTGSARRDYPEFGPWLRFGFPPTPQSSTLSLETGDGGSDEEMAELVGEGLWVEQIGFPLPDPFSGTFGGEVRHGYRIRHGAIAEPIRGGTVGGVLLSGEGENSLLKSVLELGSRATLAGYISTPPILFDQVPVSGS